MKIRSAYINSPVESNIKEVKITDKEKKFFADLYPQNKTELMSYHYYEKNGKLSGVKVGSLFDRKA